MIKKTGNKKVTKPVRSLKSSGLSVSLYDLEGKEKGKIDLPKEIFTTETNNNLLAQYVRVYLSNQRQGTASTKTRSEVKASTRKIYRQKGTGRARHGALSAPIFVGGGIAFGPKPKDYSLKLNKKQRRKAFFSALALSYKDGNIAAVVDETLQIKPKTKKFASLLKNANLNEKKILLVLPEMKKNNLVLASRNIPRLTLKDTKSLNAFDVLNSEKIIFVKQALDLLKSHFLTKYEH